jgi:hypothetical protein
MLTPIEKIPVTDALEDVLIRAANAKGKITTIFSPDEVVVLKQFDLGPATAKDYATGIVRYCLRDRWNRTPCMLLRLLRNLVDEGHAHLVSLRDRVEKGIDPILDPIFSSWFTANQPFFWRPNIRKKVKGLIDCTDWPILLVRGPKSSGKTYTGKWLSYLSGENYYDFRFIVETLDEGAGPSASAEDLAYSLVAKMGRPPTTIPQRTTHRYEKRLSSWVVSEALQPLGVRTWIVLDGFSAEDLDGETAAMIQELAIAVLDGEASRRIRLILLDFTSKLAKVDPLRLAADDLPSPQDLKPENLVDCLRQHFIDTAQNVDDSFLEGLAARLVADAQVLAAVPENKEKPWLQLLNGVVYDLRHKDPRHVARI